MSYRRADESQPAVSDRAAPVAVTAQAAAPPQNANPLRHIAEPAAETGPITIAAPPLSPLPGPQNISGVSAPNEPVEAGRDSSGVELLHYDARVRSAEYEQPSPKSDADLPMNSAAPPNAQPANTPPSSVAPATAPEPLLDAAGSRRLAPRSNTDAAKPSHASAAETRGVLPFAMPNLDSLSTAGKGLAVVVGLFLICMWLLRRTTPNASGALPEDAFAVLGRAPLVGQSFVHLLRLGNKLVLVSITPEGAHPLAEVTDPEEVDRIAGLCTGSQSHAPSAEFRQVLAQLSQEPARGFLGREAASGGRRA